MALIDCNNKHGNWFEALSLWNKVANWAHYQTSDLQLRNQIKALLVYLWNEKDWLKQQYPSKSRKIELFVDKSKHIKIIGDLANTVKHRKLEKRRRSTATQTSYYGRVSLTRNRARQLYFINLGGNQHGEILEILRGAIEEFEELRFSVASGSL